MVVASNDTDVFAFVLHYTHDFVALGVKEVWIMFGVGEHCRSLPLHVLLQKLSAATCKIIFKAYVLSGCDLTSKLDSKQAD